MRLNEKKMKCSLKSTPHFIVLVGLLLFIFNSVSDPTQMPEQVTFALWKRNAERCEELMLIPQNLEMKPCRPHLSFSLEVIPFTFRAEETVANYNQQRWLVVGGKNRKGNKTAKEKNS